MTPRVPVTKMHGARNDFIVVDARRHPLANLRGFALRACERHTGIGADGVLAIEASARADAFMRVINADGSEAAMCGNGVRCVARYLDEQGEGGSRAIETPSGIVRTEVIERGDVYRVRVDMGVPRLLSQDATEADSAIVDTGNKHLVLFRDDPSAFDLLAAGEAAQRDERYPDGINVHVVAVVDERTLRVRHYERGAGLTMACGTGAVASAIAAIERAFVHAPVTVLVPGGTLEIEWDGEGAAFMTGPAERVFESAL